VRRWIAFLVPFAVVVLLGTAVVGWNRGWVGDTARGEPVFTTFEDLDSGVRAVRISGMAHYSVVVEQHAPGNLFHTPKTYYLFGLFPPYDTASRMISVLVRTTREPEDLVSFELMTIEGRLSRPALDKVPFDTEVILGKRSDYYFAEDMLLLEPWTVEEGLDPRVKPQQEPE